MMQMNPRHLCNIEKNVLGINIYDYTYRRPRASFARSRFTHRFSQGVSISSSSCHFCLNAHNFASKSDKNTLLSLAESRVTRLSARFNSVFLSLLKAKLSAFKKKWHYYFSKIIQTIEVLMIQYIICVSFRSLLNLNHRFRRNTTQQKTNEILFKILAHVYTICFTVIMISFQ